jgi:hypothetical protein
MCGLVGSCRADFHRVREKSVLNKRLNSWLSRAGLQPTGLSRRLVGIGLIALSVPAFLAPLATGTWSLERPARRAGSGHR